MSFPLFCYLKILVFKTSNIRTARLHTKSLCYCLYFIYFLTVLQCNATDVISSIRRISPLPNSFRTFTDFLVSLSWVIPEFI